MNIEFFRRRSESMSSLPTVGLRTPPRAVSPVPTVRMPESTPPTDQPMDGDVVAESYRSTSPPGSGSTTPTNSPMIDSASGRKSMAFLDLSPFTGFLRSRHPPSTCNSISRKSSSGEHSNVRSAVINSEADEGDETVEDGSEVREQEVSDVERGKTEMNGHMNGNRVGEKYSGEEDGSITPVTRGVLLHPTATG